MQVEIIGRPSEMPFLRRKVTRWQRLAELDLLHPLRDLHIPAEFLDHDIA